MPCHLLKHVAERERDGEKMRLPITKIFQPLPPLPRKLGGGGDRGTNNITYESDNDL